MSTCTSPSIENGIIPRTHRVLETQEILNAPNIPSLLAQKSLASRQHSRCRLFYTCCIILRVLSNWFSSHGSPPTPRRPIGTNRASSSLTSRALRWLSFGPHSPLRSAKLSRRSSVVSSCVCVRTTSPTTAGRRSSRMSSSPNSAQRRTNTVPPAQNGTIPASSRYRPLRRTQNAQPPSSEYSEALPAQVTGTVLPSRMETYLIVISSWTPARSR